MSPEGRLAGKVAVVTGAAPRGEGVGNGMAVAILFAREGAKVVLVNRDRGRGEALAEQIKGEGGEAVAFAGDMTQEADAAAMADFATRRYGRLDVLHTNIGYGTPGKAEDISVADWHRIFDGNATTTMLCAKHCIPKMRAGGGGSIITVSSVAGATGLRRKTGGVAYAAAKGAVHGLTYSLAADYAAENIRVNCLIVGTVYTPLVAHLGEEGRERRRNAVPLQTEGTGWDVAHAAVYLASDESRWVTGAFIPIDGGFLAIREWPQ